MRSEPEIAELGEFLKEFNKESDRGAVLLAASLLDEKLLDLLSSFLLPNSVSEELLTGFNAPLGTFSSRIKAAFSLGLIGKNEYDEINIVRKIRNHFGHSWKDITFESALVVKELNKLGWYGPTEDSFIRTNRNKFDFAIIGILGDLLWRKRLVKKNQIQPVNWPNKLRKN